MSCESIRTRILDLALDERPANAELRAHLDSCPGCRDALAARRTLLAEIDRVLTDEMREEPSPRLAARVRQAIEAEPRPRAWWGGAGWTGWVPAGAIVALVVILGFVVSERLGSRIATVPGVSTPSVTSARLEPPRPPAGAPAAGTGAAREAAGGSSIDDTGGRRPSLQLGPDHMRSHHVRVETAGRTAPRAGAFPEVLVPAGEMNATLRLSAASAVHPLVVSTPEDEAAAMRSLQPLSIEKIEIAPLTLTPLEVGAPQPTIPSAS